MAKRRLKEDTCLNCGFVFNGTEDNFCPACGQENDHKIKSVTHFFRNFFSELLNLDSQVFRSIIPFLFRPGRLTLQYIQGKRKKYVAPIRLYLVMSFFYFFVFSFAINENVNTNFSSSNNKKDRKKTSIPTVVSPPEIKVNDSLKVGMDSTTREKVDSVMNGVNEVLEKTQNTVEKVIKEENKETEKTRINWIDRRMGEQNTRIMNIPMKKLDKLYNEEGLSEEEVIEELKIEDNFWSRFMIHRMIRMLDASPKDILENYLDEIPLMMFFLIPFFALVLKILYFSRHYVAHLIFTLNIHSFIFLIYGILFLVNNYYDINEWFFLVTMFIVYFYIYKSFRNVYRQGRILTLFKLSVFFTSYIFILSFGLIFALVASFLFM